MIISKVSALLPGSWGRYLHFCDLSGVMSFFFLGGGGVGGEYEWDAQAKIKHLQAFLS